MKRFMMVPAVLSVFSGSAFAEVSVRQGGGMMRGGWWWGMYYGWFYTGVIAILIIGGIFLILAPTRGWRPSRGRSVRRRFGG
jgi:hypothetical protein